MRFFKISLLFCLIGGVGWIAGCEHAEAPEQPEIQPTFRSIQANIFTQSCARSGCHAPPIRQDLNLSEGEAYENLVNVPSNEKPEYLRVDPQDPDSSYLVMKLEGSDKITGSRMPLGEEPLSDEKIQAVREWIENGASLE